MRRLPLFTTSCVGIAALAGFITLTTAAYAQTFITFDVPNATSTQPAAINPAGEITGSFVDDAFGQHGFLRQADGTLTTFDAPAHPSSPGQLVLTGATSINAAGQIAGFVYPVTDFATAFVRQTDGTFVDFLGDCFGPTAMTKSAHPLALPGGLVFVEGNR